MHSTERRHPRFDFSQFSWVFSLRLPKPASPSTPVRLEARNISAGGLKFVCNNKIPLFETIQISIFDRASGSELATLNAKVVRLEEVDIGVGELTYGIAVEFLSGMAPLQNLLPASTNEAGT